MKKKKIFLFICLSALLLTCKSGFGQARTVGLFLNDTLNSYEGYTLFAPKQNTMTYLINNEGRIINEWNASTYPPGQSVYLEPDGHLLRTCMTPGQLGTGGGEGGRVEEYDWNDNLVWSLDFSTTTYMQHHDIKRLPNGNIIMLVVEKKTYAQVIAAGFDPAKLQSEVTQKGFMLPDYLVEIQPTYPSGGIVVWEWHVWDHLIQDYSSAKLNYGVVSDHPELIDCDGDRRLLPIFWNHMNSIDYNPALDQIALSVRGNSEVWIIDHSTTTAQAACHTGGNSGKGGDLLYRWGNPLTYNTGNISNRKYFEQHDVEWVKPGCPGAGNLTCYNNGLGRNPNYSTVDEITPPVDANGNYTIVPGSAFGPSNFTWTYQATPPSALFSTNISGAQRLPNGNTLICEGGHGDFTEVTSAGVLVWKYLCPVDNGGRIMQGETIPVNPVRTDETMNSVFRVYRYPVDYAAFTGRDITPGDFAELYSYSDLITIPADTLSMGDHHGFIDPTHPSDEIPVHPVKLDTFLISPYELTNQEFCIFLNEMNDTGKITVSDSCVYLAGTTKLIGETGPLSTFSRIQWNGTCFSVSDVKKFHPVVCVRWFGAIAYCNWLSEKNGYDACYDLVSEICDFTKSGYCLPTEAEWEYAGRGGHRDPYFIYPNGNTIIANQVNLPASGDPFESGAYPYTTPVGFYDGALKQKTAYSWPGSAASYQTSNGSNGFGLYDMQGNVWELVNDWYGQDYYDESPYENPGGPDSGFIMPDGKPYRGMRGGNWYNGLTENGINDGHSRVANRNPSYYRGPQDPNHPWYHIGFRIAQGFIPVSVSIGANTSDTVFEGTTVTFTACPVNGGFYPVYQWKVNGIDTGESGAVFTYTPANNDQVFCQLTSSLKHVSGNPATSDTITLTVMRQLTIDFPAGWSGFSAFMAPVNPAFDALMAPATGNLTLAKTFSEVYWPAFGINTIGNFNVTDGYYIKMNEPVSLSVTGFESTEKTIALVAGWNLLPVLSEEEVSSQELSSQLGENLTIVTEIAGSNIFWPEAGIFSLMTLVPGKCYLVKVTEDTSFTFPD